MALYSVSDQSQRLPSALLARGSQRSGLHREGARRTNAVRHLVSLFLLPQGRLRWTAFRTAPTGSALATRHYSTDDETRFGLAGLEPGTKVDSIELTETAWSDRLDKQLERERAPVIYIHGYDNSAEDAIRRGFALRALLCPRDTAYNAIQNCVPNRPVIVLTWPSNDNKAEYTWDEANEEWVADDAVSVITHIVKCHPGAILIAHSMGNRILIAAARAAQEQHLQIARVILASPDVDRDFFVRFVDSNAFWTYRTTLYGSRKDQALTASWRLHGYPRAGDLSYWIIGDTPGYPYQRYHQNLDIVDTSEAHAGTFAHAAFIESPEGAADLCHVLADPQDGTPERTRDGRYFSLIRGLVKDDDCAVRAWAAVAIANGDRLPDR